MANREREVRDATEALARLMRANPSADTDVLAHELVMALDARGWRYVIEKAPDWAHGGAGLPDPDGPGGRALAEVKAKFEARTGHA